MNLNDPRCRICPMLSPECADHPCAMYGWPLSEKERRDPQRMYETLEQAEENRFKAFLELRSVN